MIVRDEAQHLPDCLRSLRGAVDEIIVIDACSRDGTPEIARDHGARVISRVWTGDFAAARNAALEAHGCEFSLYIDADERLRLPHAGRLADYIDAEHSFHLVRFQPRRGLTRYGEWRVFRASRSIRFEGVIHESIVPAARRLGAEPIPSAIEIDHVGYDGRMDQKWRRNLPLLRRALRQDPDRAYLWLDLAECLLGLRQRRVASNAIGAGLAAAERHDGRDQRAAASLLYLLAVRMALEEGQDPWPAIEAGLALRPDDHALLFLKGQQNIGRGRPQEALTIARQLATINPDDLHEGPLAFDRAIFREGAAELEGQALTALGRRAEAAIAFARAGRMVVATHHD